MHTPARACAAVAGIVLAAIATGCGGDHGASVVPPSDRTIQVTMTDNAFTPTTLDVAKGETVTFSFTNTGATVHEAVVGDDAVQSQHHDEMAASTEEDDHGGDGHGSESGSGSITVEPGASGDLVHTFDEAGTILIGCHEPGHWEAGMKATITVG